LACPGILFAAFIGIKSGYMKNIYFSALITSGLLTGIMAYGQSEVQPPPPVTPPVGTVTAGAETVRQGYPMMFDAYMDNKVVIIRWRMVNEAFIDHYTIERSTDNKNFFPLHDMPAQSVSDGDYKYEDGDGYPSSGVNYYRLKIVDYDGNAVYSPVAETDRLGRRPPVLRPTVLNAGGTLHVTDAYYTQPLTIDLYSQEGTRIGSFIVNGTAFDIPVNNWSKGIYFYRVSDSTHPLIDAGKIMIL
jgi:hypothetical protein